MPDADKLKRRVRSLLEVARAGSGATEPERATARALAARILAAHGWTEADIPERLVARAAPPPPPPPPPQSFRVVINIGGGFGGFGWNTSDSTQTTGGW